MNLKTKKMSGKSDVWKFFTLAEDRNKTICTLCKAQLSYKGGGTSSMRNHLKFVHKSAHVEDSPSQVKRQTSLRNFHVSKAALGKSRQEAITKALALMCAVDLRPLSIVTGLGFQRYSQMLNPGYATPCRTTVKNYIQLLYKEGKRDLMDDLNSLPVSITTDMWTSVAQEGYITVTAHFIQRWQLKCKVLATRVLDDRHTGENLSKIIHEIRKEFGIKEISTMTTDNASNMVSAAQKAQIERVPCFSHTLQLAVTDGLKKPQVQKALAASRRLVGSLAVHL